MFGHFASRVVLFFMVNPAQPGHLKGFRVVAVVCFTLRITTLSARQSNQFAEPDCPGDGLIGSELLWIVLSPNFRASVRHRLRDSGPASPFNLFFERTDAQAVQCSWTP
jgi:hypothetical protein